jgi:hypothetical protein
MDSVSDVNVAGSEACFFTFAGSDKGFRHAMFLIKSLRTFGGSLRDSPFLVFVTDPDVIQVEDLKVGHVHFRLIEIPLDVRNYWFGDKVWVCAEAERLLDGKARSIIWMNPQCMIVNPPERLGLNSIHDAAFRPVHIQNVGLISDQRPDPFWHEIYRMVGLNQISHRVESYVDSKVLQPYFNTHLFSINPGMTVLRTWLDLFRRMITDQQFQRHSCESNLRKIFLHQSILSALVVKKIEWERIRILPPEYSYPLHLHHEISPDRQASSTNDLVCPVYEDEYHFPETHNDLEVREPLLSWIAENKPGI